MITQTADPGWWSFVTLSQAADAPLSTPEVYCERTAMDLEATAGYLAEHGWVQHVEADATGRVCLLGALARVVNGRDDLRWGQADLSRRRDSAAWALLEYLNEAGHIGVHGSVAQFNDAPTTTAADAIAALTKAAIRTRERVA
jgi:hypothetical protein